MEAGKSEICRAGGRLDTQEGDVVPFGVWRQFLFPWRSSVFFSSSLQQIGWSTATLWRAFCFVQSLWLNANHISSLCRPGNPGLIIWPSAWVLQPSPVDTKWTSTGVNLGILFTRFPTKLQKSLLVASCRYGNKIHETRHKWKGELLSKNEPPLD